MKTKIETTSCGTAVVKIEDSTPYILLVRPFQDRDSWGIPKGHINVDESEEDCARRETYEETGIHVDLLDKLTSVKCNYRTERKTVVSWIASQVDQSEVPYARDGENVDVKWFAFDSLPTVHVYQRSLIQEVIEKVTLRMKKVTDEDTSGNS